jgi:cytochrome P450
MGQKSSKKHLDETPARGSDGNVRPGFSFGGGLQKRSWDAAHHKYELGQTFMENRGIKYVICHRAAEDLLRKTDGSASDCGVGKLEVNRRSKSILAKALTNANGEVWTRQRAAFTKSVSGGASAMKQRHGAEASRAGTLASELLKASQGRCNAWEIAQRTAAVGIGRAVLGIQVCRRTHIHSTNKIRKCRIL